MICNNCGVERSSDKGKCKNCNRLYQKKWYSQNREKHKKRSKAWKDNHKGILRKYILSYLETHPCVDCGETDPVVLQFDHRESRTKPKRVSHLLGRAAPLETLIEEIAKCDVRCANCHMRRTAKEFGWYKVFSGE